MLDRDRHKTGIKQILANRGHKSVCIIYLKLSKMTGQRSRLLNACSPLWQKSDKKK